MPTFIMLTRLTPTSLQTPRTLEDIENQVMERIRTECKEVEWEHSFAVLGPHDYLDIFRAPDMESAAKVATIIRTYGHAQVQIWGATEWKRFKELIHDLDRGEQAAVHPPSAA